MIFVPAKKDCFATKKKKKLTFILQLTIKICSKMPSIAPDMSQTVHKGQV
jgi:hypothetical protein